MKKHVFFVGMLAMVLALVFGLALTGCATTKKAKELQVTARSNAVSEVRVTNSAGVDVYVGNLPARFPVDGKITSYTVHYTGSDGNPATFVIKKTLNYWVFLDVVLGGAPAIIDIFTNSWFTYNFSPNKLPISYNPNPEMEVWIFNGIPEQLRENLVFQGSLNQ